MWPQCSANIFHRKSAGSERSRKFSDGNIGRLAVLLCSHLEGIPPTGVMAVEAVAAGLAHADDAAEAGNRNAVVRLIEWTVCTG